MPVVASVAVALWKGPSVLLQTVGGVVGGNRLFSCAPTVLTV